jgi:hypothetical protein
MTAKLQIHRDIKAVGGGIFLGFQQDKGHPLKGINGSLA